MIVVGVDHAGKNRGLPNTGIGGSSYGGVATLYALLAKPGEFGYGLIESPTLSRSCSGNGARCPCLPANDRAVRLHVEFENLRVGARWVRVALCALPCPA